MGSLEKKFYEFVIKAVSEVYKKDKYLIDNKAVLEPLYAFQENEDFDSDKNRYYHVSERAIVFRFAHYLQNIINEDSDKSFLDYHLDCEYNRNIARVKQLPKSLNKFIPDVILHKRGNNKNNFAVMEFKVCWSKVGVDYDEVKITQLTKQGNGFNYKCGFAIIFNQECDQVEYRVYKDGKCIEDRML